MEKSTEDDLTSSSRYNVLMQQKRRANNTNKEDELHSSSVASFDDYVTVMISALDDLGRGNLGERVRDIIVKTFYLMDEKEFWLCKLVEVWKFSSGQSTGDRYKPKKW